MTEEPTGITWDSIVIGGGAAGLMAVASAVRCGKKVLLLEKNVKLGVKILMSGGTRCNITHDCEPQGIVDAFGASGRFLHSALAALTPSRVVELVESQGVETKSEPGGKIFPVSNKAIDVRDALVRLASDSNCSGSAKILAGENCRSIEKLVDRFDVRTDNYCFSAKTIVLTTGGKSYPGCGTTGDGYVWAKTLGHKIIPPVPALTPLTNADFWTHQLKGIAFDDVQLKIRDSSVSIVGKKADDVLDSRRGGFLFTHFGYSGPAVLDISKAVSRHANRSALTVECDFEPSVNAENFRRNLTKLISNRPRQSLANVLCETYPKRFVELSLQNIGVPGSTKAAEVSKSTIKQIEQFLKSAQFPVSGIYGFKKAEVTAGGIALTEIDSRNMQSKICPGLYFAGEVIDLDGPIGGYNFQAAFSTGWLAGKNL